MRSLCHMTVARAVRLLAGTSLAIVSLATVSRATALLAAVPLAVAQGSSKLASTVIAQVERSGEAEVFVMLDEPALSRAQDLRARRRAIRELRRAVLSGMPPEEVRVHERLSMVSGFSASVTTRGLSKLLADPAVVRIDPMQFGSAALAQSVPQIRADAVHHRDDFGQDVTVAVLDTGVDTTHPDLDGSVIAEQCFCSGNCCPDGSSNQSGPGSALATFDDPRCKLLPTQMCSVHGTHVTGIMVSKGIIAPVGVAPLAKVVAVKVLDDEGRGSLLDWIKALNWIAETRADVQAINMSLVSDQLFEGHCDSANAFTVAFAQVLRVLRARGTLTFVAAGNGKPGNPAAMGAPACVSAAVAVGAVTKSDAVATFGNSDSALDLLAPGDAIVSTGPKHSTAVLSGTSMATPHATGVAALLLAIDPDLGADQLENFLLDSGPLVLDPRNGLTFPRLNALAAMNRVLSVTRPLTGTGSHRTDCLAEWNVTQTDITRWGPIPGAVCRDNDPGCDADQVPGQCTFQLSICFNVPDRRLPRCDTGAPIASYRMSIPSAAEPGDTIDLVNAANIHAALPVLPIAQPDTCTASIPFFVRTGRSNSIHFSARAADGRMDHDRLRFTCLPAQ
jgi:hypothetical protein